MASVPPASSPPSSPAPLPAHQSAASPAVTDPSSGYPATDRATPTRLRERASYDRASVHAILDEGWVCHLGFVRDGAPVVLPTLYARHGERLYVHGSTGSRPLRGAGPGLAVCLTVTHVDGLVLARSAFHHSINYRSVVVHGTAHQVTDPGERALALDAIVEQAVPGRAADCRRPNVRELAATTVIRLDLGEVSAKIRSGGPGDEPEDLALPHWTGVVPVARTYGAPIPADDLDPAIPLPAYLPPAGPRGGA
ncbi:Nitroimidazol reductase NimA, pyridoxamine 5'-phosphate oxidase superfamily [Streptomyces sp. DvalAA-14]|uniref:pyridoxamine 5'-phosphate oxidase family protein n=1 Tax=unclassified Streptomyces TaxID=2593676 RepID=UPI00081B0DFB|nr:MULTISPECIES: pyridoxamine 5'-phosphate oxidase family protein [unclassified Streptomyces]MYS19148.1 pyridoxamine 5'-phosphate oxidase family protein [Streptomyces sp. SID4948]SCD37862.1 Nitroimidazol reductase NimA, pyridoxamine 5'-phosphate oxidase superfamily [Streptomyces sp. DvalAA-14]